MSERGRPGPEFISEAQEVIEALSRNLLQIEEQQRATGTHEPELLNAAFRAVHTLKGLAGLFGAADVSRLSHSLESRLDDLRLGKLALDGRVLDVLFESVETFQRQLATYSPDAEVAADPVDVAPLLARIDRLGQEEPAGAGVGRIAGIDDAILGVLTEYEEHRLRENLKIGRGLFRVHASFDLLAIDVGIEALKDKMKAFGEVITYLPSADASADDRIELDIILGSSSELAEIAAGVAEDGVSVHVLESAAAPSPARAEPAAAKPAAKPAPAPAATAAASPPAASAGGRAGPDRAAGGASPVPSGGGTGSRLDPTQAPSVPPFVAPLAAPAAPASSELAPAEIDSPEGAEVSLRSLSQTVRVDLHRLDHLMNLVGELGLVQANLGGVLELMRGRRDVSDVSRELQNQVRAMTRKLDLLQQGILDVRMVPLGQVFDKLARVVRKLGREAGKEIRLGISGADTELDKLIVEELSDPLMHMIRNAIDHGIELPDERTRAGKPSSGHIHIRAFQKGNRVVIEVEDDGRGIDWRAVRDVAVRRKVVAEHEASELTPAQAINLIFVPGFSTRDEATELSGRGVGMDVVKTNIAKLSGMIDVETEVGAGTKFSITLPVTLAIIQALVIAAAGQVFCIPLNSVLESIMVQIGDIGTVEGHQVVSLRGRTLPLLHLSRIFGLAADDSSFADPQRIYVVIVGLAQHRVGLVVDELLGQQDVVIKPLGRALRAVPGIAGATELGSNRAGMLLDVVRDETGLFAGAEHLGTNRTVLLLDVATLVAEAIRGAGGLTASSVDAFAEGGALHGQ